MDPDSFLEILKDELRSRGYEEVEPNPLGGGIWTHPDWDTTDKLFPAIADCLDYERPRQ